LTTWHIY